RFDGVAALREVGLTVAPGTIHGLVGENGAGKSTLGKIIAGVHPPDEGEVLLDGDPVVFRSPRDALAAGIALIGQELSLVPQLTVMENVLLGTESRRLGMVDAASMRRRFADFARLGFNLDPDAPVGSLRTADQQKVEILRAVAREVRLIVMDEPTSSLTPDEAARLFAVMTERAGAGTAIVYISHDLASVLKLSGRVTVLRDGRVVRSGPAAEETVQTLVSAMIGRSLGAIFPAKQPPPPDSPVVLAVRGLGTAGWVRDVSFELRRGEILGVAGLIGSGRTEVARAISGAAKIEAGDVAVNGQRVKISSPRDALRRGIAMLPESRKSQGLVLGSSVLDNVTLPHLGEFQRAGLVLRSRQQARAHALCDQVDVRGAGLQAPVSSLSGGNQQKVMFAKWLCRPPQVLLADEPTRGVDVAAKHSIYELLVRLAAEGLAILLISSELEEVLELAHRVLVMRQGRLAGELDNDEADEEAVLHIAFGNPAAGGAARA
ncbi:MAG: sugar ABC transporter ATP-binding protein, partial [Solirubrobacteraceae bacterium]